MEWAGLLIAAPFWGVASTILFYRGWLSFLGVAACLIFLFKNKGRRPAAAIHLFNQFTLIVFYFALLLGGFLILFKALPYGRTTGEIAVYWISATIALVLVLPGTSKRIEKLIETADGSSEDG